MHEAIANDSIATEQFRSWAHKLRALFTIPPNSVDLYTESAEAACYRVPHFNSLMYILVSGLDSLIYEDQTRPGGQYFDLA